MDRLDLLAVQGILKSLLQHHGSKASILLRSAFFIVQLLHPYMTTGKTIALTRRTFVTHSSVLAWRIPGTGAPGGLPSLGSHPVFLGFPGGSDSKEYACNVGDDKSLQLCPTLCDPRDGSPLGSPVPGILQARTLEWVAISFSNA